MLELWVDKWKVVCSHAHRLALSILYFKVEHLTQKLNQVYFRKGMILDRAGTGFKGQLEVPLSSFQGLRVLLGRSDDLKTSYTSRETQIYRPDKRQNKNLDFKALGYFEKPVQYQFLNLVDLNQKQLKNQLSILNHLHSYISLEVADLTSSSLHRLY